MRVSFEGSKNISLFGEALFWGEKPWLLAGRLKRLFFMLCLYSWDDIWGRERQSFSAAFNCGIINLLNLLVSIGWARGALCHRMCLRWHLLAVGTHDCKCKMYLLWTGLLGAPMWSYRRQGAPGSLRKKGILFLRWGRHPVIFLLFPVFHWSPALP